jgi:hypothetical protein
MNPKSRKRTPVTADTAPLLEDAISTAIDELPTEYDPLEDLEREARCVELSLPNVQIKIYL